MLRRLCCLAISFLFLHRSAVEAFADPPPAATTTNPTSAPTNPPSSSASTGNSFWSQDTLLGNLFGIRTILAPRKFSIALDWVSQGFANFDGGAHTGTTAASTLDLKLTGTAWSGSQFYMDLEDHAGPDPSEHLVGDLQRFSNFNSKPFFEVAQLWYQQALFEGVLSIKIGKVDANTEFGVVDNGVNFLNSSAQVTPTIVDFPTYPIPMPGVNLFFTPTPWYYASFAAYDVSRGDKFLDFTSQDLTSQLPPGGVFLIAETGFKWTHVADCMADGNFRMGAWGETGTLTNLNGGEKHGTQGFYAISNQTLWMPRSNAKGTRGLRAFVEYGETPGDVSVINRHVGAGITSTGFFAERPDDVVGFGPEYVHLSDKAGLPKSYELAIEGFYQFQIAPWASVQPDLQYIVHPGGEYSNALVGTLQMTVHF